MNKFDKALEVYGEAELSRWMLPSGQFLAVPDWQDHRIVGQFCKDTWLEFIADGACSLHYDHKAKYLWIRTCRLLTPQRMVFQELIDNRILIVEELLVHEYDCFEWQNTLELGWELSQLYLTDTIAYRMALQY